MDKKRKHTVDIIVLCVLVVTIALLVVFMSDRFEMNDTKTFKAKKNVVANPMIGFAPMGDDPEQCADTNLVFIRLRWADWEPEEGRYNYAFLNTEYHWSEYKKQGKHAVIRFVCDLPEDYEHMDIPQWLYDMTGDGLHYDRYLGIGYSPNYENRIFRQKHKEAIQALADYCNKDDFATYIQLGSLGHWGEWHVSDENDNSLMPGSEIAQEYVQVYMDAFDNAKIMMRRSYSFAVDNGLGVFNDVVGNEEDTKEWMDWMVYGDEQETAGEPLIVKPYEDFWVKAPVGGEITSSIEEEVLQDTNLISTLKQIEDGHMSWLGPKTADKENYPAAYDAMLRRLGYKIYVSKLETVFDFTRSSIVLKLSWANAGIAPMYWDWPVTVKIYDSTGEAIYWETLDLKLSDLLPGTEIQTKTYIPLTDSIKEAMDVGIEIKSFDGDEYIQLANDSKDPIEVRDGFQIIYEYKKEE